MKRQSILGTIVGLILLLIFIGAFLFVVDSVLEGYIENLAAFNWILLFLLVPGAFLLAGAISYQKRFRSIERTLSKPIKKSKTQQQ